MLEAVLFDMDGTLLDSEPLHLEAIWLLLRKLGVVTNERLDNKIIGTDYVTIWKKNIEKYNIQCPLNEILRLQNDLTCEYFKKADIKETPGLTNFLKDIRERAILTAVASSSPGNIIDLVLKRLNIIEFMDVICGAETVRETKPSPEVFLLAAKRLGVSPGNCLVFEDSPLGIDAAKAAGMKCIAVRNPDVSEETLKKADKIICSFLETDYKKILYLMNRI